MEKNQTKNKKVEKVDNKIVEEAVSVFASLLIFAIDEGNDINKITKLDNKNEKNKENED